MAALDSLGGCKSVPAIRLAPSLAAATMAGGQFSAMAAKSWPLDPNSLQQGLAELHRVALTTIDCVSGLGKGEAGIQKRQLLICMPLCQAADAAWDLVAKLGRLAR